MYLSESFSFLKIRGPGGLLDSEIFLLLSPEYQESPPKIYLSLEQDAISVKL